jgi:hypothetical protein
MKKAVIFMIICFFAFPCVYAGGCAEKNKNARNLSYNTSQNNSSTESGSEIAAGENNEAAGEESPKEKASREPREQKESFRIKDRGFEVGINVGAGFSNNLMSAEDIFRETVELDLDNLTDDLGINFGLDITPFYFKFSGEKFGYGLSINIDATGIFNLSKELIALNTAVDKKSELNAAIYVDAGIDIFFNISKLKVSLRPAAFYPLAILKSSFLYTFDNKSGTLIDLGINARLYTPVSLEDNSDLSSISSGDITKNFMPEGMPGIDFSLSLELPLTRAIGLQSQFPFLDFDLGLSMINIPINSASLKYYMERTGNMHVSGDSLEELFDSFDSMDEILNDSVYGEDEIKVYRPFKMLAWVNFRPINGTRWLTITPSFGYSINNLYEKPFSYEGGLKVCLDIINVFIITAGINYEDRMWVNSLNLALNIRLIEINAGVALRSQEFMKNNMNARGVGARVGVKLGW